MAEPKARTLQERMGFRDDELKTPKHDEMMLWLDANIQVVLEGLHGVIKNWNGDVVTRWQKQYLAMAQGIADKFKGQAQYASEQATKGTSYYAERAKTCNEVWLRWSSWAGLGTPEAPRQLEVLRKTWEHPVTTGRVDNPYVVGFIDLQVFTIHGHQLKVNATLDYEGVFRDEPEWEEYSETELWNFEVKPTIPSLGELIRQIAFYRQYVESPHWVVVSPDTRFQEPLKSQGILLVKYPYA